VSDWWAALVAVAAAAGAWVAKPLPLWLGAAVVAGAFARRSPPLLCLGAALLASALGARAWAGLAPPPEGERWEGWATLVSDPADVRGRVRVELRAGERRLQGWAGGGAAGRLRDRLAGELVWVEGEVSALPDDRFASRHLAGRLSVESVGAWAPGDPSSRVGNALHRALRRGAEEGGVPEGQRALFTGLVLGDDRDQPPEMEADFRASGLAHLLVVSGQNVAFALAAARPLLARLGLRGRLLAGLAVLALFGTATRWEPSVLRAAAMAALTLTATAAGRPASTRRRLALAVAGLLLVDPLLVRSVGFLLSVGASAGIALLSAPLARALPGPRPLADALAVTLAAQAGVAPLLVPLFGGLPVAALVANLLAVPAAGPVTAWGLTAGAVAGLVPGVAPVLHLPTRVLVGWIEWVARLGAALPLGRWEAAHVAALAVVGTAAWVACGVLRRVAVATAVAVALAPALAGRSPPAAGVTIVDGARLWRRGDSAVLVLDDPDPARLLDALHARGVRAVDVLVTTRAGPGPGSRVRAVLRRLPVGAVVAPPGHALPRAVVARPGLALRSGTLTVHVEADLTVEVASPP
jgi:competence protein ComEC